MTLTAVILLTISAFTHAGWNLFGKKDHPSTSSFLLANLFGTLLLVPVLILGRNQIADMVMGFWPLLLLTGFFQATYFTGLVYAYKTGELSVTYPLARSLPSLLVAMSVILTGQGGTIGIVALAGMFLIVMGSFLIPLHSFKNFSLRRYTSVAVIAAVVAAIGTTGYSLTDDYTLSLLRKGSTASLNDNALLALYYIGIQGITTVFWQSLTVIFSKEERQLFVEKALHPLSSIIMGAGIFLTYSLALLSMGYVSNVSYVVAFRQFSIPLGLVFGILFLKEQISGPKITAVALLFTGVILVALG